MKNSRRKQYLDVLNFRREFLYLYLLRPLPFRPCLNRRYVLSRRHPGNLFELPGKIMDGRVSKKVRNLCKIHLILPDQLLCKGNFHLGEKFNNPTLMLLAENFLELGTADQVVTADLLNGDTFPDMFFQVKQDFGIVGAIFWTVSQTVIGKVQLGNRISADHQNQHLFQINTD